MRSLIVGVLAIASVATAAPAFAQGYGPDEDGGVVIDGGGYGYGYGPDAGYGYGPVYRQERSYSAPIYEGRSAVVDPEVDAGGAVAYCANRFRSYDPASGTYLGFDGYRHSCP